MQEILYMCFGIFIFVLGLLFNMLFQHKDKYASTREITEIREATETTQEEDETYNEIYNELEDTRENTSYAGYTPFEVETYTNIPPTHSAPPQAHIEPGMDIGDYIADWTPTIHQEEEVDVEIMTAERESYLYRKAKLQHGGV